MESFEAQLADFRADLAKASTQIEEGLPDLLDEIGRQAVAGAQSRARTPADRRMAGALDVSRSRQGADVIIDADRVPGALGQEFGARHNQLRPTTRRGQVLGWNQFPDPVPDGRLLGPALEESWADDDDDPFLDLIDDAVHPAFPD